MPRLLEGTIRAIGRAHMAFYRRFGARGPLAADMLILTTNGRKTGRPVSTPLLHVEDGGRLFVVASFGGNDRAPGWYRNLEAHPGVEVEIRGRRGRYEARTLDAEEAGRIWPRLLAMYPPYASYQKRTARRIPVVELRPVEPGVEAGTDPSFR